MSYPHIISNDAVTVFIDGEAKTFQKTHGQFESIVDAIRDAAWEQVKYLVNIPLAVKTETQGRVNIVNDREVWVDGELIHNSLTQRIVSMVVAGNRNFKHLTLFLENLKDNPSQRAIFELYDFLSACDLPITSDGHFLAYKKIRSDYTDIYSGSFDNSIGSICQMDRDLVDEDKHRTCSAGLHFCSKDYLSHFGSMSGNRVVIVKINPADVVAIPADYNNAKGRTWRYEVVGEVAERDLPSYYTSDYDEEEIMDNPHLDLDLNFLDDEEVDDYEFDDQEDSSEMFVVYNTPDDEKEVYRSGSSLNVNQVRQIKGMLADGWTVSAIVKAMNKVVSERQIRRIRDGENWADITI